MNTHIKTLIISILILFTISCNRDKLPEPTESGNHTFGSLVDGNEWRARGGSGKNPKTFLGKRIGKDLYFIHINAYRKKDESNIKIDYDYISGVGTYKIWGDGTRLDSLMFMTYEDEENGFCRTVELIPGILEITHFDTEKQVISGKFEFNAVCENKTVIKIRNGRFDLEYD